MSIIRKLDEIDDFLCCDHNDVCEGEVSHVVCEDDGTDKKYYCCEHADIIRERLFKNQSIKYGRLDAYRTVFMPLFFLLIKQMQFYR